LKIKNPVLKIFFCFIIPLVCLTGCSSEPEKRIPELHTIVISSMQFNPAELVIAKGDTVEFVNKDIVIHDINQDPDKTWSSSKLSTGQTYKVVIKLNTNYYCSIHPGMKGKITVQ
jgi:plastocyanin